MQEYAIGVYGGVLALQVSGIIVKSRELMESFA
jgi:hypothetical protein